MIRFALVGLLTTFVDIGLFGLLVKQFLVAPAIANVTSYSCGILISFLCNRNWTFAQERQNGRTSAQMAKFVTTYISSLLVSTVLVSFASLVIDPLIAKAVSVPVVFFWNYLLVKNWVFRA